MFKRSLYFIALCCILLSNYGFAVPYDSKDGNRLPADSTQINQLIAKGNHSIDTTAEVLLKLTNQLQQLSAKTNNKRGLVYAQVFYCYYYWHQANFSVAMQTGLHAIADAEKWNITRVLPDIYSVIANLHKETGNYNMAFAYNKKAINQARLDADTSIIIVLLGQQAMFIHSHYIKIQQIKNDNVSLGLQLEALKMAESLPKYERLRISIYDNIAQAYKGTQNYKQAIFYANKGVELAKKYGKLRSLTYSYCWLGESYYYLGEHDKGIAYLQNAIAITQQIKQPYRQMELYQALFGCYKSTANYQEAIASLERFTTLRDSLQVAKGNKQISELQLKYETAKKDKEITYLNDLNTLKSRKILWISIAAPLFAILLVIILYQNVIIHKNSKLITLKNQMLQQALDKIAFIQSHQVRKPLASIMGLINIIKSDDYHPDKEVLLKMETAAHDLDQNIRDAVNYTEIKT